MLSTYLMGREVVIAKGQAREPGGGVTAAAGTAPGEPAASDDAAAVTAETEEERSLKRFGVRVHVDDVKVSLLLLWQLVVGVCLLAPTRVSGRCRCALLADCCSRACSPCDSCPRDQINTAAVRRAAAVAAPRAGSV